MVGCAGMGTLMMSLGALKLNMNWRSATSFSFRSGACLYVLNYMPHSSWFFPFSFLFFLFNNYLDIILMLFFFPFFFSLFFSFKDKLMTMVWNLSHKIMGVTNQAAYSSFPPISLSKECRAVEDQSPPGWRDT